MINHFAWNALNTYSGCCIVLLSGVLNKVFEKFLCLIIVNSNWALNIGSSKHGIAFLASIAWNWVVARLNQWQI